MGYEDAIEVPVHDLAQGTQQLLMVAHDQVAEDSTGSEFSISPVEAQEQFRRPVGRLEQVKDQVGDDQGSAGLVMEDEFSQAADSAQFQGGEFGREAC